MQLIVLHGFPGVGKLEIGKALSQVTGFPLFHNHLTVNLVDAVFDFPSKAFTEVREQIWIDVMGRTARENASTPRSHACDGTPR